MGKVEYGEIYYDPGKAAVRTGNDQSGVDVTNGPGDVPAGAGYGGYKPVVTAHEVNLPGVEKLMNGRDGSGNGRTDAVTGVKGAGAGAVDGAGAGAGGSDAEVDEFKVTDAQREAFSRPFDEKIASYRRFLDSLPKQESEVDRRKRERRERARRIVGAVSDGIRAMANLHFTNRYAPNMYSEGSGQLKREDERIERMRKERERNSDLYMRIRGSIADAEVQKAKGLQELEQLAARNRQAAQKAEADRRRLKMDEELHPGRRARVEKEAEKAGYEAEIAGKRAARAEELEGLRVETERDRGASYRARTAESAAKAGKASQDGVYGRFDGVAYANAQDYSKAVYRAVEEFNKRNPDNKIAMSWERRSDRVKEEKFYDVRLLAARVEAALADERDKRAPHRRKGEGDVSKDAPYLSE